MKRAFRQVNVFSLDPLLGNPLAVVHAADRISDDRMAGLARWTNLSETTFLLTPTNAAADYRVRIFTPGGELPFAGHPTLGTCHAWLAAGGEPRDPKFVVQQCEIGLVRIRRDGARLEFAAPPVRRTGPVEPAVLEQIVGALRIGASDIQHHQWVDNGPGWCAVMLRSAAQVLSLRPNWPALGQLKLGVIGPHPAGHEADFEVRALIGDGGYEDPVTGSLNASVAQWLIGAGLAPTSFVASQGAALNRAGRVYLRSADGEVWVGGDVVDCIQGEISLPGSGG